MLEGQGAQYPVAALAYAGQSDPAGVHVLALQQSVHDRRDDLLPVMAERNVVQPEHRVLARAVEDQRGVAPA